MTTYIRRQNYNRWDGDFGVLYASTSATPEEVEVLIESGDDFPDEVTLGVEDDGSTDNMDGSWEIVAESDIPPMLFREVDWRAAIALPTPE